MAFNDLIASADRAVLDALGEPVVYRPQSGDPVSVSGIFENPFALVQGDGMARTEARTPTVFLFLSDLPTNPGVDEPTLTIGGVDYSVAEDHPDGVGGVVLVLETVT